MVSFPVFFSQPYCFVSASWLNLTIFYCQGYNKLESHLGFNFFLFSSPFFGREKMREIGLALLVIIFWANSVGCSSSLLSPKGVNFEGEICTISSLPLCVWIMLDFVEWCKQLLLWWEWRERWETKTMFLMDGILTLWTLALGTWLAALLKALSFLCGYFYTLFYVSVCVCVCSLILFFSFFVREMPSMGLSGTLSPSIGNLTHLRTMWVLIFTEYNVYKLLLDFIWFHCMLSGWMLL